MDDSFDLTILNSGDPDRAIAVARSGFDLAIESLSCKVLQELVNFRERLSDAAKGMGKRPTTYELVQFGQKLFSFTINGTVAKIYDRLPQDAHIRLQIYSNRAELQALPWEYIQQPKIPSPDVLRSVIRVVPTIGVKPASPLKLGKKVRLLFVYADPLDQPFVDFPAVQQTIEREFRARLPSGLEMDVVEGATRDSFSKALNAKNYDILHFAGHGQIDDKGQGEILLREFGTGKTDRVSAMQLDNLMRGSGIRLVVLSSCSTSAGDFGKEFAVLAKTLVEIGIPVVVANQFPITNSIAATFAGAFYQSLLQGGDADRATGKGRQFLAFNTKAVGNSAVFEWGVPTLYRHVGGAQVFEQ
jgi:hypothetical protein